MQKNLDLLRHTVQRYEGRGSEHRRSFEREHILASGCGRRVNSQSFLQIKWYKEAKAKQHGLCATTTKVIARFRREKQRGSGDLGERVI